MISILIMFNSSNTYCIVVLFNIGAIVPNGTNFGEGTGMILLDNVQCTGSERQLRNCAANSSDVSSCTHAQDAAVRCARGMT